MKKGVTKAKVIAAIIAASIVIPVLWLIIELFAPSVSTGSYQRISRGMTERQVWMILGSHDVEGRRTGSLDYYTFKPEDNDKQVEVIHRGWYGDDIAIWVDFDNNGIVLAKTCVFNGGPANPSFFEKMRKRLSL
jgi:hypothetical protein